jgi:hypothetical protein
MNTFISRVFNWLKPHDNTPVEIRLLFALVGLPSLRKPDHPE